ncbi:putative Co/Zn/Cd efflux system membrane fusion protein [Myxococcus hansupus]|uniref:Putative Co/Zn/Cd efflux system membrane fusion protein n=1 Tax=Pseudomyxococcus hansupus TaxID=1297742 RepID=A0A0H4WRQ2_9BACT|nr:efflux RND transporter periplasmic adaptor subunit [Myxococcus hansupus]AKQ64010.1 putative Co/Zn/Cd efflux system membrane fusion protein [Myxococcus hansupus]
MRIRSGLCALLLLAATATCSKPHEAAGARHPPPGERTIPVDVAPAQQRDVPIYLDGLGTVVAFKTVTVRTQVNGRMQEVFFREGQPVRRGEALAQIDPRPFLIQLRQAEAALARDKAQLATNTKDLKRYQYLAERRLIPQQQADDQQGLADQGAALVRADEAAIAAARLNLEYARIVSPLDGVTGIRMVDPGNLVSTSDTTGIVVVTQLDPIAVFISVPQERLADIARQQRQHPLEVIVLSRDGGTELGRGTLTVIDNIINPATSTLRLKAVLANPDHGLWPNAFVKARLLLETRQGALTVPAQALQRGPDGTFVYVMGQDHTVQPRPVTVGLLQGPLALIDKGLNAGEQVITEGQNQLHPGSKVAPRKGHGP